MKKLYSILFLSLFLTSCGYHLRLPKSGKFRTNLEADVTHNVSKNLNSYNTIIVPSFMRHFSEKIGYFSSVLTHSQVNRLLDLDSNTTVNPHQVSELLKKEGMDEKYLVLEEFDISGLRKVYQWNLTDPVNEELLFSARVLSRNGVYNGASPVGNSLLDYLKANSEKIPKKSR